MGRWVVTKSARTKKVNSYMNMIGMKTKEEPHQELSPSRIKRDNSDFKLRQ